MDRCKYNKSVGCSIKECATCEVYKVYQQGRADAIEECKKIVKEKCTIDCMYSDCIECMCRQFDELKEKKE